MNATTSPPVFKLQDFEDVLAEQRQKKKDRKVATKELITSKAKAKSSQTVKEMYLSAGIDKHDFYTKMNKVKDFLSDGHSVRMAVVAKGKQRVNSGEGTHGLIRAVQEMVIQALEFVQQIHFPLESNTKGVSVLHKTVQIKSSDDQETPRVNPLRKEFTLVPKSK